MAERMRPDSLVDSGPVGHPAHDTPGTMAVEPLAVDAQEDRPGQAFADGKVDGSGRPRRQRYGRRFSTLAEDR